MARRNRITVVEIRAEEVLVGDVINRRGHFRDGWMEVGRADQMQDGQILIADLGEKVTFLSQPLDILWLQIVLPLSGNSHFALPGS
ncbi:MAG: hypothetical protein E6G39_11260 [Actinobacteria bacterium]|nr:MAG: hypothetical protein E6G39_11260 [Actinomycetota bacterium]